MHDACLAISRGELDVVLVTGAEAMYTRALARRDPAGPAARLGGPGGRGHAARPSSSAWTSRAPPTSRCAAVSCCRCTPTPSSRTPSAPPTDGRSTEHAARIGALWSRFSEVAAGNPHAWIRTPRTPGEIVTPGPGNRMVSLPYPSSAPPTCRSTREPLHRLLGGGGPRRRGARGALGLPARGRGRQRPLVHFGAGRAASLPRHPAGRRGRTRSGRPRHRRRGLDRPLLVLPRRRRDGCRRTRAGCRRSHTAPDTDRWTHVRRRARATTTPRTASPAPSVRLRDDAGYGGARHRPRVVRHQALRRGLRVAPTGARRRPALRLARHPARGRRPAPEPGRPRGHRPGARGDLHGDIRPRRRARARHPRLPDQRRQPCLGQRRPIPTPWPCCAPRRGSAAPACSQPTGRWRSTNRTRTRRSCPLPAGRPGGGQVGGVASRG